MKELMTFDEHLDQRYGRVGTEKRTEFEIKAKSFAIGEILREARKDAQMTQEELARKTGTRKSFISRIENGHSDIQLSTLYRLVEIGFGKRVILTIGWVVTKLDITDLIKWSLSEKFLLRALLFSYAYYKLFTQTYRNQFLWSICSIKYRKYFTIN